MKVRLIEDLSKKLSVSRLCRLFEVSRTGTLVWLIRDPSKRDVSNEKRLKPVKHFHNVR